MVSTGLQFRARIVPTGQCLPWLQAREAVQNKGGLPPHPLLDDWVVRSEEWKGIREGFPLWSAHVLVCPARDRTFRRGESVMDVESRLIFPADCIPSSALNRRKTVLFVLPRDVEETPGGKVIYPATTQIIHPVAGEYCGEVHETSRLPLEVSSKRRDRLPEGTYRFLARPPLAGVYPLVRGIEFDGAYVFRVHVYAIQQSRAISKASYVAYDLIGVAGEELIHGMEAAAVLELKRGGIPSDLRSWTAEDVKAAQRAAGSMRSRGLQDG